MMSTRSLFENRWAVTHCRHPRTVARPAAALLLVSLLAGLVSADDVSLIEEQAMRAAVDRVAPAVVRIETVGGLERIGDVLLGTGPTTGLVVSADGYIVSSAFNFVQKPSSILVTLPDGARHPAVLVARDRSRMIVLLKVKTDTALTTVEYAPTAEMHVGQWAIAVGRTFEGEKPNLSIGIISALARIWGRALQTDAKISPANYGGPLVDISGRVLGLLVPLSPDAASEVAGVEWYDSGIGFAVPLEQILKVLPKLQEGRDLYPGIFGINFKSADIFTQPAVIAACRVNSPAYKAGFKAGDTIVEAGGQPVTRQAQLKHEINSRYAGDKLKIVALRGEQRIEREIELVDKLEPYDQPFLGILPLRPVEGQPDGLVIRYVFPDSPAAQAGLVAGDRLVSLSGAALADAAALAEKLRDKLPGESISLEARRGDETLRREVKLGRLPEALPAELPAARREVAAAAGELPQVGQVPLKVAEFENECLAYVPENYDPRVPYGVVVWLHAPGGYKPEELLPRWRDECRKHDLILLAPKSADVKKWQPDETKFVRRVLDAVLKNYNIDRTRVVVHGHEGGGALAWLVALTNKDVIRAVAVVDAPLSPMAAVPDNDPVERLAILTTRAAKAPFTPLVEAGVKRLREMKFPVTVIDVGDQPRYLTPDEQAGLIRWIDALDRL